MDRITAGGLALRLDLASAATGGAALASAQGEARIARTTMLRTTSVAGAPPAVRLRLLGKVTADVALGNGRAIASGDDATCSARAEALGDIAFIRRIAAASITPSASTCLCSVFAIARVK